MDQFSVYVVLLHHHESLVILACRLSPIAIMNNPLACMPWTFETFTGADLDKHVDRIRGSMLPWDMFWILTP